MLNFHGKLKVVPYTIRWKREKVFGLPKVSLNSSELTCPPLVLAPTNYEATVVITVKRKINTEIRLYKWERGWKSQEYNFPFRTRRQRVAALSCLQRQVFKVSQRIHCVVFFVDRLNKYIVMLVVEESFKVSKGGIQTYKPRLFFKLWETFRRKEKGVVKRLFE